MLASKGLASQRAHSVLVLSVHPSRISEVGDVQVVQSSKQSIRVFEHSSSLLSIYSLNVMGVENCTKFRQKAYSDIQ